MEDSRNQTKTPPGKGLPIDDDDLTADVEDKNASYSEYSVNVHNQSQMTTRSGNSSNSGSSSKKRKQD